MGACKFIFFKFAKEACVFSKYTALEGSTHMSQDTFTRQLNDITLKRSRSLQKISTESFYKQQVGGFVYINSI